jgi:hypothetical protein
MRGEGHHQCHLGLLIGRFLERERIGTSSWLAVISVVRRPRWLAVAHDANPVLFGAHLRAYPLGPYRS